MKSVFSWWRSILKAASLLTEFVILVFMFFINVPTFVISLIISRIPRVMKSKLRCCMRKAREDIFSSLPWIKENYWSEMRDDLLRRLMEHCVDDMNKWRNVSASHHMVDMLSTIDLSTTPQLLNGFEEIGKRGIGSYNGKTCLSLVALVKAVAASVPDPSNPIIKSMVDTLGEAFEIVYYVDRKMNVQKKDSVKQKLARSSWKDEGFDKSMKTILISENPNDDPVGFTTSKLRGAYDQIEFVYGLLIDHTPIKRELRIVSDFIVEQRYATIEELCVGVRQLFCEMLHHLLAQLPICVYKDVHDASFEYCEKPARYLTKLLCKLDPLLEDKVKWNFPEGWPGETSHIFDGTTTTTATSTHHETTNAENEISTEGGDGGSNAQTVVMEQVPEQQSTEEIRPADASDNV